MLEDPSWGGDYSPALTGFPTPWHDAMTVVSVYASGQVLQQPTNDTA